jgi:hypothetical protein
MAGAVNGGGTLTSRTKRTQVVAGMSGVMISV